MIIAVYEEHKRLMDLAKQSKWTRDFSNIMFSSPEIYAKGWIMRTNGFTGFWAVRHKVRKPATSLYFFVVDKKHRRMGIGVFMLAALKAHCPHPWIELNVAKENVEGTAFWLANGFKVTGESLNGSGLAMELKW